ncbi:MAG: glycosyltransferase [Sphingobacteriaceae bacterium]|nr:MAG: glycosyltransferase [Sphingobacteriaceae bacterium]
MTEKPAIALPTVSIIIVTYNAAADLQKCLDSVYAQQYPAIEIIVMDGASTDGTVQILQQNNSRIWFKSEKDAGIYDAMNKALQHINGQWVYFLGADDELLPDFSALCYELKDNAVIYYGSVYKNGEKYLGEVSPYRHAKLTICHQAIIYPATVFDKYRFDEKYRISADHVLNMWCWKDAFYRFKYVDVIVAIFNDTGISSVKKDLVFEKNKARLILENYGMKIWLRFLFKQLKSIFKREQ